MVDTSNDFASWLINATAVYGEDLAYPKLHLLAGDPVALEVTAQ
nr:hypothetical protein [Roseomonas sp. SXEYE001]